MKTQAGSLLSLLIFINFFLFISCNKKKEVFDPPHITWNSPLEGSSLNSTDTVLLTASIRDNDIITLIRIRLKNDQGVPVLQAEDIRPNKASYEVRIEFPLIDPELNGSFYFEMEAYDENNFSAAFRHVQISALPLRVDHFLIFSNDGQATDVFTLEDKVIKSLSRFNGDFLSSAVDVSRSQAYIATRFSGQIYCFEPVQGDLLWKELNPGVPGIPVYNHMSCDNSDVLFSMQSGELRSLDHAGNNLYQSKEAEGFYPSYVKIHDGKAVIYEEIDRSSGDVKLRTESYPSGDDKGSVVFPYGRVAGMFSLDWDKVLVFANRDSVQFILTYNTFEQYLTLIDQDDRGLFGAMEKIDDNRIAMKRGNDLVQYYISQHLFTTLVSNYEPENIRYNRAELLLYCSAGNEIRAIDPESGQVMNTMYLASKVSSMELLYNY